MDNGVEVDNLQSKIRRCVHGFVTVVRVDGGFEIAGQLVSTDIAGVLYSYLWRYAACFGRLSLEGVLHWLARNETWPCAVCGAPPELMVCGDCTAQAWRLPCEHGREGRAKDGSGYLCDCADCVDAREEACSAAHELASALPYGVRACAQGHDVLVHDDTHAEPVTPTRARAVARRLTAGEAKPVWEMLC